MPNNYDSATKITSTDPVWYQKKESVFIVFLLLVLIYSLGCMIKGWNGSLIEFYPFRQTQTAISVDYMLKGGALLGYETPVLGPPWSIPLEFPFYQYFVFLLVKLTGYPIEKAGRMISLLFFISAVYPLYNLVKTYFNDNIRAVLVLTLFCMSPQYIYWSRSFMIESAAMATSLWYVYFITKYVARAESATKPPLLLWMILVLGMISSVTKVTTFFIYYIFAFLIVFSVAIQSIRTVGISTYLKKNLPMLIFGFIVPVVTIFVWTHYTDSIKSMNPIGSKLMSANLQTWNFGSLSQKLSLATWNQILLKSSRDLLGNVWVIMVLLLLPFCKKRTILASLFLMFMFIMPMAVFTNLYYVHSYYVYANGVMLIAVIAIIIGDMATRGTVGHLVSVCLLMVIFTSSFQYYKNTYLPIQGNSYRYQKMKWLVDLYTKPNDVLVYVGADWSSEMPFYTNRRASMFPASLTTNDNFGPAIKKLSSYRIGGVVFCDEFSGNSVRQTEFLGYLGVQPGGKSAIIPEGCDLYFPVYR